MKNRLGNFPVPSIKESVMFPKYQNCDNTNPGSEDSRDTMTPVKLLGGEVPTAHRHYY